MYFKLSCYKIILHTYIIIIIIADNINTPILLNIPNLKLNIFFIVVLKLNCSNQITYWFLLRFCVAFGPYTFALMGDRKLV